MDYKEFFHTDNKSGWKCVESKLRNKRPDIYRLVINFSKSNGLDGLPFLQKVYHFINDVKTVPVCQECGKDVKFLRLLSGYQQFCGVKCSNKNAGKIEVCKSNMVEKYGVDTSFKIQEVKEQIIEKNIANFGVDNPFKSKDVQDKIRSTFKEKYGDEVPSKTELFKEKYRKTCNEKYGFDNHLLSPDIREKITKTTIENHGVDNPFKLDKFQIASRETTLNKYGDSNIFKTQYFRDLDKIRSSNIELDVCNKLNGESRFRLDGKEFDILLGDDIIEVDGDAYHPSSLNNLSITQLNCALNDATKNRIVLNSDYNLTRVKVSDIHKLNTIDVETLKSVSYTADYSVSYNQKILTKEYLRKFIETKGKDKLAYYVPLLLKFVREFQPQFPLPDDGYDVKDIMSRISKFDESKYHNKTDNSFNNNTYCAGVTFLKSIFKSYWNSSFKGKLTPVDYWIDDDKMLKVIAYRIGLNDNNEVYDFTMNNLVRGISAVRGTVSFFKPIVASGIYKHYLNGVNNPVVFDPCCGFGGRLLGFHSTFNNGKYIGCEPNIDTYNELNILSDKIGSDSVIYNSKLEDMDIDFNYDIAFTSIPYFDLEDYNNGITYSSFDEWKDTFIKKLISLPRIIINIPYDLAIKLNLEDYIDGYLVNSKTHYSSNEKREVLLKMNF